MPIVRDSWYLISDCISTESIGNSSPCIARTVQILMISASRGFSEENSSPAPAGWQPLAGFEGGLRLSRPGELHPLPLAEPDVNLSVHPAPIIQPFGIYPAFQCTNTSGIALSKRSRVFIVLTAIKKEARHATLTTYWGFRKPPPSYWYLADVMNSPKDSHHTITLVNFDGSISGGTSTTKFSNVLTSPTRTIADFRRLKSASVSTNSGER